MNRDRNNKCMIAAAIGCFIGALLSGCNASVDLNQNGPVEQTRIASNPGPAPLVYLEIAIGGNMSDYRYLPGSARIAVPMNLYKYQSNENVQGQTATLTIGSVVCTYLGATRLYSLTGCSNGMSGSTDRDMVVDSNTEIRLTTGLSAAVLKLAYWLE